MVSIRRVLAPTPPRRVAWHLGLAVLFGGLALVVLIWSIKDSVSFETCVSNPSRSNAYKIAHNGIPTFHLTFQIYRHCFFGLASRVANGISALATVVVAAFTITLWRAAERQHAATMGALQLAREEFNATHRPRLIVRDIHYISLGDDGYIYLYITNVGDAIGRVVELKTATSVVPHGDFAKNIDSEPVDLGRDLWPGDQIKFKSDVSLAERIMMLPSRGYGDTAVTGSVHLTGNLVYVDRQGRRRRTRFQRKHVRDEDVFMELGNPNYEYAD